MTQRFAFVIEGHLLMKKSIFPTTGITLLFLSFTFGWASIQAQNTEADYYQNAYKLYGTALRTALHNIVKGHTVISYDGLYTAFPSTDSRPGTNNVWDIYSDKPGGTPAYLFVHGLKKCGNYSGEGDCYNREHSWPDSWLGATNPARSDLFHMYPTDGYVNNRRSNYPFGTVANATWTSTNGSKVGSCSFPGYTSTVFEPIDAYKGDLARSMMYMSVRYYLEDSGFSTSPATNKSNLLPWYANLLYSWHIKDTVSTKEINRNNAIFTYQKNRNPFIDHPEFAAEIWQTDLKPQVVKLFPETNAVVVDFSRYIDSTVAVNPANFVCNNGVGSPVSINWGVNNDVSKLLVKFSSLATGTQYTLTLAGLKSINGILMNDTTVSFVTSGTTDISGDETNITNYKLDQNFPNPFNPSTVIKYQVPANIYVTLKVFDTIGNEITTLVDEVKEPGSYSVSFNGEQLSSGIYFYKMQAGGFVKMNKLVLMK